ncbi:hypothetical protein AJ88_11775 [Mesorhizobium amorphae CCBAU 01583]|nr:hypothetical protein AJ88_11775 [Mesorhizobium amorphae CCBAU 01583]
MEPDENLFDALQNADQWISISGALKSLALSMAKMCNDLRLMSSGPRAGFSEITLPAVQPGSSIMPGKINPVIPEMAIQVYFRVLGNDATVTRACEGELDLNVWESIILNAVTESIVLLNRAIPLLVSKCIAGIAANEATCRAAAEGSLRFPPRSRLSSIIRKPDRWPTSLPSGDCRSRTLRFRWYFCHRERPKSFLRSRFSPILCAIKP